MNESREKEGVLDTLQNDIYFSFNTTSYLVVDYSLGIFSPFRETYYVVVDYSLGLFSPFRETY